MKSWNVTHVCLFGCGLVLFAFILPGLAQDTKTTKPTTGQPAGKKAQPHILKAKTTPKIVENNGKPRAAKAITLKDLKDAKTGKAPANGNAMLTLHNKAQVSADKHVAALNRFEQLLNKKGFSLWDKPGKQVVQHVALDTARLNSQAKALSTLTLAKTTAAAQARSTPAKLQAEHLQLVKVFKLPPFQAGGVQVQPISVAKSFSENLGDPSVLGASINGSLAWTGDVKGVTLSASGKGTALVLGHSADLVVASASLNTPRTGGLSAKVKVTVLGVDALTLDKTEPASFSKTDSFSLSLPDNLRVEYEFSILGIPMQAQLGLKGSARMTYFVSLIPGRSALMLTPEVQCSAFGQFAFGGTVSILGEEIGALAGVEGDLTILDDKMFVVASVEQGSDNQGLFIKESFDASNTLNALSGSLSFFIEVDFLGTHRYSDTFFTFSGFTRTFTPFSGAATQRLQVVPK
jgi:hypothetical protein